MFAGFPMTNVTSRFKTNVQCDTVKNLTNVIATNLLYIVGRQNLLRVL